MAKLLKDFPPGPLDHYRKRASFDWKKLKVFLFSEEVIKYENELYEELQRYPEYEKSAVLSGSLDETRRQALRQSSIYRSIPALSILYLSQHIPCAAAATNVMMQMAPSSTIKHSVGANLFETVIQSMGSDRHMEFLSQSSAGQIFGCFCLTEIGHGSNAKGMRTTATYDKETRQFLLHTPDFEAAKCWAGSLGQQASHAVVFAQLIVDGQNYGLHPFVVQVRDPKTLKQMPGVTVGDMGEKIGLNGIDNGFVMFSQYPVPRVNLLNKTGDVTEDGRYVTSYRDASKKHGASLGALSGGRVGITSICAVYGAKALTIALRYAAVRRQFGPDGGEEVPILEYQTHQHRLLPYLAAVYAIRVFSMHLLESHIRYSIDQILKTNTDSLEDRGLELHVVSSASKPVAGWTMRDAIQECREACGGHGYLKAAGLGDLRNDHDANCTYEGENHVLIQQTSNALLKYWPAILKGEKIATPMKSANFLSDGLQILRHSKFNAQTIQETCCPETILQTYQWLTCYLLQRSYEKLERLHKNGTDQFWAKNEIQVFYARNLATAFIQHFFLQVMLEKINSTSDRSIRSVLTSLFSLYGLWALEKQHVPTLFQGGYLQRPDSVTLIQEGVLEMCRVLKDDAVALIDTLAVPDFVLGSVLGASDGMVYQRLQSAFFENPMVMSRPAWWRDIVEPASYLRAKY